MYASYPMQPAAVADQGDDLEEEYEDEYDYRGKRGNTLPTWGNVQSMNLNPLIMTNIQSSPYFKVNLLEFKTYHQVIDEIYYKVDHLEPWERGSRKTSGQTGMCGGVRGVGAGGIVSSSYCLLFKLYTLKLTRKQVMGLLNHRDSPYIRGLGFMYVRYTQPPTDLWDWFEEYLDDEEEIDAKAGGGKFMTIGMMLRSFLTKLEWFDTRFPRIPVNVQKQIDSALSQRPGGNRPQPPTQQPQPPAQQPQPQARHAVVGQHAELEARECRNRSGSRSRDRRGDRDRDRHHKERDRGSGRGSRDRKRSRSRDRRHRRDRSPNDYVDDLNRYSSDRRKKDRRRRSKSRSRERR